jgi:hypothetical protein
VKLGVTQLGRGEEGLEVDLDAVEGGGCSRCLLFRAGTAIRGGGAELNGGLQMA